MKLFSKSKTRGTCFRTLLWSAVVFFTGMVFFVTPEILGAQEKAVQPVRPQTQNLPHYDEIMKIIQPLNYSGFYVIQKSGVTLSVDFKARTWTFHGMRRYAPDGTLLLDEERSGLCAELAYHTFQKIKPILSKQWEIKFVRVIEPDFFSSAESNHVALILGDPVTQATYLLDPSFHLYGTTTQFPQYTVLGAKDDLRSFEQKNPDVTMNIDSYFPLLIRNGSLILFSAEAISGSLDPKNFVLAISSRPRDKTSHSYLIALRKQNGQIKWLHNEGVLKKLLTQDETKEIQKKLASWAKNL